MNGCHHTIPNSRIQNELVYHSKGNVSWPYVFTKTCQYIKQAGIVDAGCDGCYEKEKK
jgi:hypothetical protein